MHRIGSYNANSKVVSSRYVNIKYIINKDFYFSNYDSPKAYDFESHEQISCTFLWTKINVQIRILAKIKKASKNHSDKYFAQRDPYKNLSISSNQSKKISSYDNVLKKYDDTLKDKKINLLKRPSYWGGYKLSPYQFEFWYGHNKRLNKRIVYNKNINSWKSNILEP